MYGVLLLMVLTSHQGGTSVAPYKILSTSSATHYSKNVLPATIKCETIGNAFLQMKTANHVTRDYRCIRTTGKR